MADKSIVNPNLKRVPVSFVGSDGETYVIQMSKGQTTGTLFALMGLTAVTGTPPANSKEAKRGFAIENGLAITLTAECRLATGRLTYKKILVPTPKIEETIKSAAGKTLGTATVIKVRASKNRLVSA